MRRLAMLTATTLLTGVLTPVLGAGPAQAATTFTQNALSVVVTGASVTATTNVGSHPTTSVAGLAFCTTDSAGNSVTNLGASAPATIRSTGTTLRQTGTFPAGTYSTGPCVNDGGWTAIGAVKTFTVGTTSTSDPATEPQPVGVAGSWSLKFRDEFSGTSLDRSKWSPWWFKEGAKQNGVATNAANVAVAGGQLVLTLASSSSGASVTTNPNGGATTGYDFKYGYTEARVLFPGSGSTVYNWPAWWADGQSWPADGENDIAEGLGTMTSNYHSSSGSHNQGTIPGTWSGGFHTYGLNRQPGHADVYFDGVKVKSYPTDDSGRSQYLILNVGNGNTHVYGAASQVKVDYVRAWQA
jgi:hypothetical protein